MAEPTLADMVLALETYGPPPETRTGLDTASLVAADPELGAVEITDLVIDGPHGDVPVRRYRHPETRTGEALVWMHGGAWITGTIDQPEAHWVALKLAARGVTVLSVSYRKALHGVKFPVPSDDVFAAWTWAIAHPEQLDAGHGRIHLGGASAGANLAAGVAVRCATMGVESPASVVLVYPLVHAATPQPSAELVDTIDRMAPAFNFTPEVVVALTEHYAGESAATDPIAFAGNADLAGQPPVLIVNAEADELRASGEEYARQLRAAGVDVEVMFERGTFHGYLDDPSLPAARATLATMEHWITAERETSIAA
jgi:acetyl esterase